jgi:hypothetical protein
MNNEPVAWAYEAINVDGKPYLSDVALKPLFGLVTRYGYKEIPLYTHPAKTLTDEEIQEAMEFAGIHPSKEWGLATTGNVQLMIFAKAILRKAQEK